MGDPDAAALPRTIAFVDLETTGGNAAHHRIIEIGIVRVVDDAIVDEWSSLVDPQCRVPSSIQAFTGISDAMVATAPPFASLVGILEEKLAGAVFAAHNARFDASFLRRELRRLERPFAGKTLCTVKLSRRLAPQERRHNLDALIERHGLDCNARHRALGDARVLADWWLRLRRERPAAELAAAIDAVLAAPALPAQLPEGLVDELPEGPGVYRFLGDADVPLYIGKSRGLRARILAHFAAANRDTKEQRLAQQVRRIDWRETAGELGALLTEASWIKAQRPVYNRRLRGGGGAVTCRIAADRPDRIEILALEDLDDGVSSRCYGLYRTPREASRALTEIARAHQLCLKAMGLESGDGACFGHALGRCRGACVGRESAALHGVRLQLALASVRLKDWPFPGPIALRERDAAGAVELHVIDRWIHLGTARADEDPAAVVATVPRPPFDLDVYRILARHFERAPRFDWVALPAAPARRRA
jgi:DNA polymerase-3 subunit epsilon